jgi:Ras-related protein Rab-22
MKKGEDNIKVILLGDTGVGKTSFAMRFVYENFVDDVETTIGSCFRYQTLKIPNTDETIAYQIWDTAGQEKFRSMAKIYYKDASAAILVYDCTRKESFEAIDYWVKELTSHGQKGVVLAIAGNKSDLEEKEEIQPSTGLAYAEKIHAIFLPTSAKYDYGIKDIFVQIALKLRPDLIKKKKQFMNARNSIQLLKKKRNKGCCGGGNKKPFQD